MHHGFGEEVRWRSLRTAENPYGGFHLPAQWKGYWRPVFDGPLMRAKRCKTRSSLIDLGSGRKYVSSLTPRRELANSGVTRCEV